MVEVYFLFMSQSWRVGKSFRVPGPFHLGSQHSLQVPGVIRSSAPAGKQEENVEDCPRSSWGEERSYISFSPNSIGQNVFTWPHLTAKEAKKWGLPVRMKIQTGFAATAYHQPKYILSVTLAIVLSAPNPLPTQSASSINTEWTNEWHVILCSLHNHLHEAQNR